MSKNNTGTAESRSLVHSTLSHAVSSFKLLVSDKAAMVLVLGYGCFRAANSLLFSHVFAQDLNSSLLIPGFSLTTAIEIFFILFAGVIVFLAYRNILPPFRIPLIIPSIALLAIVFIPPEVLSFLPEWGKTLLLAVVYTIAILCMNLAWTEMLVSQGIFKCLGVYALGMVLRSAVEALFMIANTAVIVIGVGILIAISIGILEVARRKKTLHPPQEKFTAGNYVDFFKRLANALLIVLFFDAAISFLNGFFLGRSLFSEASNVLILGSSAASLCFLFVVLALPIWRNLKRAYRILFPLIAATIALLPFVGNGEHAALGATLMFSYNLLTSCAMYFILCDTISQRMNVYIVFGSLTAIARLVQLVFVALGFLLGNERTQGEIDLYSVVAMAIVYGLAMLLLIFSRRKERASSDSLEEPASPIALIEHHEEDNPEQNSTLVELSENEQEYFDLRAEELARENHLTKRETEVLLHLARGRTTTFISQEFVCSPGTVRTHVKSVFAKLGVHSRQEVIDLFIC